MNPWAVVRAIMLAPDLNLKEKSLLLFIRACQGADGTSYPSVGSMGLVIGTNKREVVQGVLSKLEDSGHIKRHHRLGK